MGSAFSVASCMCCCKIRSCKSQTEIAENTVESERDVHASQCSMITAVTGTDSNDAKSVSKTSVAACSYCGRFFKVPRLVEHVPRCKEVSRLKAEEFSRKDAFPFTPEIGAADGVVNSEATVGSEEFERCPICQELFPLPVLVDHTSNCTSIISGLDNATETATATGPLSVSPRKECSIVSYDCQFCNIRLPEYLMSKHYPKCERQRCSQSRSEWSGTVEENDPAVLPEHLIHMEDLGTGLTIEDDWSVLSLPSSAKSREESTDRKSKDSHGLEWTSSQYSCCEEQCLYCLKMFAVSVLVEHACDCASRQENSADELSDLGRCCYCQEIFPLNKLINHAYICNQKRVSISGEILERCMYCFKDFPVSELIHHTQNCNGDMLGPIERFQSFIPSVHDLSAISSVAILNDTQQAALQYVITRSAQDSKSVSSKLLARVQGLGYSENDLKKTLQWVRSAAPIIIHINLDKVLKFLVKDTHYRNRFETGTSGGSTDKTARKSWEDRIFNNAYHSSPPSERVKYGVLNIVGDPRGVRKCSRYGDSFLQLKKVRLRTTFASQDTSGAGVKLSCCEHYENVLFTYTDEEITAIIDVATGKVPFHRSDCISHYKEVQIHGPVSLSENVECIVVNARHKRDLLLTKLLDCFVKQNKCNLIWMDPDDLPGGFPSSSSATRHYPSASTLLSPPPHMIRVKSRPSFHSKPKPRTSYRESRPEILSKPKPSFPSELSYRTLSQPKPSTPNEKSRRLGIRRESKPCILSESKFRTLSDSKPRAFTSRSYSYRDPDRIVSRTPATAGRRDGRSSLRVPSCKKDPYF